MLDQWFGADHRYCKLRGGNGALYILRLDENRHEWSLTSSQARKPGRSLRNPASACIRISNPTVNDEAILDPRRQRS